MIAGNKTLTEHTTTPRGGRAPKVGHLSEGCPSIRTKFTRKILYMISNLCTHKYCHYVEKSIVCQVDKLTKILAKGVLLSLRSRAT